MRNVVFWSEATERLRGHLQCIHFQILPISDFTHKLIVVCCVLKNESPHVIGTYSHLYVFCYSWAGWVYLQCKVSCNIWTSHKNPWISSLLFRRNMFTWNWNTHLHLNVYLTKINIKMPLIHKATAFILV